MEHSAFKRSHRAVSEPMSIERLSMERMSVPQSVGVACESRAAQLSDAARTHGVEAQPHSSARRARHEPPAVVCCGFTLIELLVVLAIVGLLAALAVPVAEITVQRSREQDLRLALREIRAAIDQYKKASDEGRIPKRADATGYPESLDALVAGIDDAKDAKKRKIYFLRRIPRDPMHPDPAVEPAETWAKRAYESEPNEPREGKDVYDVYSRSTRIGLNGVPYNKW